MLGPSILARSMSIPTVRGSGTRPWQYHSRSDTHSKIACWTLLFDFLLECDAARSAVASGKLGFGINHEMVGPINKTLDLVVTRAPPARTRRVRKTFASLVGTFGIRLDGPEGEELAALPVLEEEHSSDVSEVLVALEAKACMTEHSKSLPRLHAEILATGYLAKKAEPNCITVSYNLVNAATEFISPSSEGRINRHRQPRDARMVVDMLSTAIPRTGEIRQYGYDVVGVTVIDCRNDGSAITVVNDGPAPGTREHVHYERMIRSLCAEFRARI